MKPLERLVWKVHAAAMQHGEGEVPMLAVVTFEDGHHHIEGVAIPESAWSDYDPATIMFNVTIKDGAPVHLMRGLVFTGEAWLVETEGKSDAETSRLMRQATNRRLYQEPNRISIRTTVGVSHDDEEYYQLVQRHDESFVTDVVAEAHKAKGDMDPEYVMQRLRTSAIPAAMRNLMGRLIAAEDLA
jgi:hypothetical protein